MNFNQDSSFPWLSGISVVGEMKGVIDVLKMQKEQDAQKMKSRRVEYKGQDSFFIASRFIFECGYKLKCHPVTIATAATIFHRFFREVDIGGYDKYLIAATALYLAGKVRDEHHKLRDVINVTHHTLHRGATPLDLKDEYWNRRDAIVQAELLVMRVLKFEVAVPSPHKFLLHYLKTLQGWVPRDVWENMPLAQSSFAFLQDFHHNSAVLDFPPQLIAIGCINLALQCYGVQVPFVEESDEHLWYLALCKNIKKENVWEVMESLVDIYNKDPLVGD